MVIKKEDLSWTGYILGIISIVLSFSEYVGGLILGIIAIILSNKDKGTEMARRGKLFGIIGIIISLIMIIFVSVITALNLMGSFPK